MIKVIDCQQLILELVLTFFLEHERQFIKFQL